MFNAYWGLRENPFSLSPDPGFLYRSQQHQEALDKLIYGVQTRKGFLLLTGEVGTGKTTLLECLRDFLTAESIEFAAFDNSRVTVEQFFDLLAYSLDLPSRGKTEVLFALNDVLLRQADAQRTTVLIVDEAQNLGSDVLEEIRLLGNLETRDGKLLQIVLAGQPELEKKLESPELRQFKQRILLRSRLQALQEDETREYVATRLALAGMPAQQVFPQDLLTEIHYRSQGIPRLINAICDNLLLSACALETRVATRSMLDAVAEELCLAPPAVTPERLASAEYRMFAPPNPVPPPQVPTPVTIAAVPVPPSIPSTPKFAAPRPQARRSFPKIALLSGIVVGLTFLAAGVWSRTSTIASSASLSPPAAAEPPRMEDSPAPVTSVPVRSAPSLVRVPVAPLEAPPAPAKPPVAAARAFAPPAVTKPPELAAAIPMIAAPDPVQRLEPPPPSAAPVPPIPLPSPSSRFAGAWTFPTGGVFHGAQPEVAEMEIRVEGDELMASLSVRFQSASLSAIEPLLRFVFSGKLQGSASQAFTLEGANGSRGTIELIPGPSPNFLEVNFFSRQGAGTQSGDMLLTKRGSR